MSAKFTKFPMRQEVVAWRKVGDKLKFTGTFYRMTKFELEPLQIGVERRRVGKRSIFVQFEDRNLHTLLIGCRRSFSPVLLSLPPSIIENALPTLVNLSPFRQFLR